MYGSESTFNRGSKPNTGGIGAGCQTLRWGHLWKAEANLTSVNSEADTHLQTATLLLLRKRTACFGNATKRKQCELRKVEPHLPFELNGARAAHTPGRNQPCSPCLRSGIAVKLLLSCLWYVVMSLVPGNSTPAFRFCLMNITSTTQVVSMGQFYPKV